MLIFAHIMMVCWPLLSILFFYKFEHEKAILITIFGGTMFLPQISYDIPLLYEYNKFTAISFGILFGTNWLHSNSEKPFVFTKTDIAMFFWCFLSPLVTSFSNNLGLKDGLVSMQSNLFTWGIFYWTGRKYLHNDHSYMMLCWAFIISAFLYSPLALFEIRMSPQLSSRIYGFFPHSWVQHIRGNGFRPIVFMQHGLMVSLFLASASTVCFWILRCNSKAKLFGISLLFVFVLLAITTVLSKSSNGISFLIVGVLLFYAFRKRLALIFLCIMLIVPSYVLLRVNKVISIEAVQQLASQLYNQDRVESLTDRLVQEDLFNEKTLQRPLFGWGGYGRGWPNNDRRLFNVVDSLIISLSNRYGFFGLISLYFALYIGPWSIFYQFWRDRNRISVDEYIVEKCVLALIVFFFIFDTILNGMINPMYILTSGALSRFEKIELNSKKENYEKLESRR